MNTEKHPHVRGEDLRAAVDYAKAEETPPRAWGRLHGRRIQQCDARNTPTCVGKTSLPTVSHANGEKHPHVRGEDVICPFSISPRAETPPRAWGRHKFPAGV